MTDQLPSSNDDLVPGAGVPCPFCGSADTELHAVFGQFLLASQYYCRGCRSVFDRVRWDEDGGQSSEVGGQRSEDT